MKPVFYIRLGSLIRRIDDTKRFLILSFSTVEASYYWHVFAYDFWLKDVRNFYIVNDNKWLTIT
jgi:hypothetical protein